MPTTFVLTDTRYTPDDITPLIPGAPSISIGGGTVTVYADLTAPQLAALQASIAAGEGIYEFRGVRVRNSVDVDNKVSADIKEAIAPGRPTNLQAEAEKALLAKVVAAMATGDTAYVTEKMTFYATVVQPIRDEGNAFIAARGW